MPWAPDYLHWPTWESAKDFANSEFVAALFAAMAGAYGGAWAAQRISEHNRLREQHADEVRSCNSAIELVGGILNTYLSLKRQHVRSLKSQYDQMRARIIEHQQAHADADVIPRLDLGALHMTTLDIIRVRTSRLETLLQERISVGGRPLALLGFLLQSIDSLNESIRSRNSLLQSFRPLPLAEQLPLIFALPLAHGVDTTFRDLINGIYRETDDCIAFSRKICDDLQDYGERIRASYQRKYRGIVPRISKVTFRAPASEELLPNMLEYEGLFAGYVSPPRRTSGRRLEKISYVRYGSRER